MKSSSHILVNPLLLLLVFMVLCPGQIFAQTVESTSTTQAKAQLHVPWNLLQERLRAIVNQRGSDGSNEAAQIGNRLISVPYEGETINWTLASGTITSTVAVDKAAVGPDAASVAVSGARIHIVLDSLSVDQVIERNVGGAIIRVHLNAVCGPIAVDQANAGGAATFALSWANGSPRANLSNLDLSWSPSSWTFNNFTCTGPSGLDQLVRDGLASYLRDPASLKPFVESYVSSNLQAGIDAALAKLREPFVVGSSSEAITVSVGTLIPAESGVVADLTLRTDSRVTPRPALPLPASSVLNSLSTSQPSLIGDLDVIEFIVGVRLAAKDKFFRINLQSVPAFHKLMKSRIEQLFVWQDLWHYSTNSPFYLNLTNPRSLDLKRSGASSLTSTIPLTSVIQSYRDSQWWSYVVTKGTATTSVAISLSKGVLSYTTTINSLKISSAYGDEYAKRYNKKSAKLPDNIVSKAIVGPQKDLSGSMKWPNINLDQAGQYRATSFKWLNSTTFLLNFSAL